MTEKVWAAERPRLLTIAYRMLGSWQDAEDALQDAWLRWSAANSHTVRSPAAYLTTTVTRLAIDRLRARQRAAETYLGPWLPEPVATSRIPEDVAADSDRMSLATLHLMERLTPPQRAVYVLREGFGYSYEEIGAIVGRTDSSARQLFRRARDRIGDPARFRAEPAEHERLLRAVLGAARDGAVGDLERVLHEQVVLWSDGGGKAKAARKPVRGADRVARFLTGIYGRRPYELAVVQVNGLPAVEIGTGADRRVVALRIEAGVVTDILMVANPDKLGRV